VNAGEGWGFKAQGSGDQLDPIFQSLHTLVASSATNLPSKSFSYRSGDRETPAFPRPQRGGRHGSRDLDFSSYPCMTHPFLSSPLMTCKPNSPRHRSNKVLT
jgi:hypothetical protein